MADIIYLSREAILDAPDILERDVEVPEWGGVVRVKGMTGVQRDAFETSVMVEKNGKRDVDTSNMRAKLVARCVVDETGARMFTNEDVQALGRKSAAALQRVFDVASELSGMSPDEVKSLEGNSDAQSDASDSD